LEQLGERIDLARHGGGREVLHALEGDVHRDVALAGERIGHADGHTGLHRLHAVVEVVDVHLEELALGHWRQRFLGITGEIGQHAHDERQLDLLLGAVELDVIFDLYARRAVARDELLTAGLGHLTLRGIVYYSSACDDVTHRAGRRPGEPVTTHPAPHLK